MKPSPKPEHPPRLDIVGAALSATGLALVVLAVLQSSSWGWIFPVDALTIGGVEITPLGFSVVPFMILGGLGILSGFATWQERQERLGGPTLLDTSLLSIETLRAGLASLGMQQLVLLGTFFVLPVYLQVVLGFDAFETGTKLVPMSVTMLIAALAGPRIAARRSPKRVVQAGLVALALGTVIVLSTVDIELTGYGFAIGLAVFGLGAGLMASQLGNVIMSSAPAAQTNEAGGLQGTAQNLGASLGTALIGAVLLTGLTNGFVDQVSTDPTLPAELRVAVIDYAESNGLEVIPVAELESQLTAAGLPSADVAALVDAYSAAQLDGLRIALGAVAVFAVLGLWFPRRLPSAAAALAGAEAGVATASG
jgi:hypothetical protein